jgi:hypothetical protein
MKRLDEDFNVTTTLSPQRGLVRIKSIRDVFEDYEFHPEPKSAAPDGEARRLAHRQATLSAVSGSGFDHLRW